MHSNEARGPDGMKIQNAQVCLSDFPHFVRIPLIRQGTSYTCGVAAMHSILRWHSYDGDINDERLCEACGTTAENGTAYQRIVEYLAGVDGLDASWHENMSAGDLMAVIDAGGVAMLPIQAWEYRPTASGAQALFDTEDYRDHWQGGHWVVACGYNARDVLFMDPSTAGCYARMPWDALNVRWHDSPDCTDGSAPFTRYEHCGIVVYKTNAEQYDGDIVQPLG